MLTGGKQHDDPDAFWRGREEEIGSPILGKALGRVVQDSRSLPLWGLVYTTAHGVYFQTFKSENWISTLFNRGRDNQSRDEIMEIPREQVKNFALQEGKRSFLGLFRNPPRLELTWHNEETGQEQTLVFEMDDNARELVEAFQQS